MSLLSPKLEVENDKSSVSSLSVVGPSKPAVPRAEAKAAEKQSHLDVPLQSAFARSSDDLESLLSTYSANNENERRSGSWIANPRPGPSSWTPRLAETWKDKILSFYALNRGLALVMVSQFFGALMNVTTRLLETRGKPGHGMHPFQVCVTLLGWLQKEAYSDPGILDTFCAYGYYIIAVPILHVVSWNQTRPIRAKARSQASNCSWIRGVFRSVRHVLLTTIPPNFGSNCNHIPCAYCSLLGVFDPYQRTFHTHGTNRSWCFSLRCGNDSSSNIALPRPHRFSSNRKRWCRCDPSDERNSTSRCPKIR